MSLRFKILYLSCKQSQEATVVIGHTETEQSNCGDRIRN